MLKVRIVWSRQQRSDVPLKRLARQTGVRRRDHPSFSGLAVLDWTYSRGGVTTSSMMSTLVRWPSGALAQISLTYSSSRAAVAAPMQGFT